MVRSSLATSALHMPHIGGVIARSVTAPPHWERVENDRKCFDQRRIVVYPRERDAAARIAKVLTEDEARRIASNIAKLPGFLQSKA